MRKPLSIFTILFTVFFNSFLFAKTTNPPTDNIYTDDKQNISVTPKQPEFIIKLKSNPTTGYSWFLREYDSSLIKTVKHTYEKPKEKMIGAAGYELWTFHVKQSGFTVPQQTTIRLVYTRPWQADSSTQLVFRVSISAADSAH